MFDLARDPPVTGAPRLDRARATSLPAWSGLLEDLPIGVCTCDAAGLLVRFNRRAVELWGRTPVAGDPAYRFCGAWRVWRPDGTPLPPAEAPMAELLRTGRPIRDRELVLERPDGTRRTVLVHLDPLQGPAGEILGGVSCFQDISARRRAEERLHERERRAALLLEALPAAIYTTDAEGRITFYNQAAVALWGCRPEPGSRWCGSWRLWRPDGTPLPHEECPMAVALRENRPVRDAEAVLERPDGSRVPFIPYPTPLRDAAGGLRGAVNMLVDISPRKQAEETQRLLIHELDHRVKNMLAIVQAIARQTLSRAKSPEAFVASFNGRILALARAHGLLTHEVWQGADLRTLVREQLLLGAGEESRIGCAGPAVRLAPQTALHLAMVLHELGTNARKHGALGVPEGRLRVSWSVATGTGRTLRLRWVERGGPPVDAAAAPGFGTVLIEHSLKPHGGAARMRCEAAGVRWEIHLQLPEAGAATAELPPLHRRAAGCEDGDGMAGALAGRRILVVEDEPFLALDIAGHLAAAGIRVVGPAATVEQALRLVEDSACDGALLDANLAGRPVDEVAAALVRRRVPFAFVTGYGRESLPAAFADAPIVAKPFAAHALIQALRRLAAPPAATVLPLHRRTGTAA